MWLLHSCQTNHMNQIPNITQPIPPSKQKRCNLFWHHPLDPKYTKNFSGITHWIPNIQKTSLHNAWMNLQSSKRWSTISPQQHMQHQLTRKKRPLTMLLIVRICPQAAAHKKNKTLIGTFKCQMLFQGTEMMREPQRQL